MSVCLFFHSSIRGFQHANRAIMSICIANLKSAIRRARIFLWQLSLIEEELYWLHYHHALLFTQYSGTLILHRRSLDTFYHISHLHHVIAVVLVTIVINIIINIIVFVNNNYRSNNGGADSSWGFSRNMRVRWWQWWQSHSKKHAYILYFSLTKIIHNGLICLLLLRPFHNFDHTMSSTIVLTD